MNITDKTGPQSETSIAVDTTNKNHILMGVNDLTATAAVYEILGTDVRVHNSNFHPTGFCYDTWIAFNTSGDAFVSYECSDQRIAYRKAGQIAWNYMTFTIAGSFPDRDMVAIDTSSSSRFKDSVYIGYDDNGHNNTPYVLYSRDGINNWARSSQIANGPTIGVNVATAPDGTVYATWEDYSGRKIWAASSADGGATWGTAHVVTNYRMDTTGFFVFIPPQNVRGIVPFPMSAVSPAGTPHAGRYYISYTDNDPMQGTTNIYVRYSDDSGVTWSAETKVNDDTVHAYHFHHAIAVAPDGQVGVLFLRYSERLAEQEDRPVHQLLHRWREYLDSQQQGHHNPVG